MKLSWMNFQPIDDIFYIPFMSKRTKIVCTIGPASESEETILNLVNAGMNVARLNFSHGTHENHAQIIQRIRAVEKSTREPIAILQDVQGPKIRVGLLRETGWLLKDGETVNFETDPKAYSAENIPIDFIDLYRLVKKGERLLLADGKIETQIIAVSGTTISAKIIVGGQILSHQGINVPDSLLIVPTLTNKDKDDIRFAVEHGVDYIALSFVTKADDILNARYYIKQCETELSLATQEPINLIAKIERKEAVDNIKEIIATADAIMIARGDLGIEMPPEEVPLIQKQLIDYARKAGKPVIVATQMLDSMQVNPRPTRAEVSDVANAVIDHTDAVMLSNETAIGKYPVDAVTAMSRVIKETEASVYDNVPLPEFGEKNSKVDEVVSALSRLLAEDVSAKIILAASITGETGRLISRYRPEIPIVVATASERVLHQLNLSWGIIPFVLVPCQTIEELINRSLLYLKKFNLAKSGDKIIVVSGEPVGQAGHVNLLEVREVF